MVYGVNVAKAKRKPSSAVGSTSQRKTKTKAKAKTKVVGRPFKKGQSGNPSGMSKAKAALINDVRSRLAKNLPEACDALISLIRSEDEKIKLEALREFFDRVAGKAAQAITGPEGEPLMQRSAAEAREIVIAIAEKLRS